MFISLFLCQTASAVIGGYNDASGTRIHNQVQIFTNRGYVCTGTLISDTWVLTARHCFDPPSSPEGVQIVGDTLYLDGQPRLPTRQVVFHPTDDAALIELATAFPLHYAYSSYGTGSPEVSESAVVRGWGSTSDPSTGPSQRLKGAYLGVRQSTGTGKFMPLSGGLINGLIAPGDSGAGVKIQGLVCGVSLGQVTIGTGYLFQSLTTDFLAPWIIQVSGVQPSLLRSCKEPNRKPEFDTSIKNEALGASITQGLQSTDGSGYRADFGAILGPSTYGAISGTGPVSKVLSAKPVPPIRAESPVIAALDGELTSGVVTMVGRKENGSASEPDNEGYPGYRIDQVAATALCSVPFYHPNLVTLLVGTNDVQENYDLQNAPARLKGLIEQIVRDSPKAVVLVSDIPPNTLSTRPDLEEKTEAYNQAIPDVVADLVSAGYHVVFAPSALTPDQVGPDNIHPTDAGYDQIAEAFLNGANDAFVNGWLKAPDPDGEVPSGCRGPDSYGGHPGSEPGDADKRWDDTGAWFPAGLVKGNSYKFADVNGDKKADLIAINPDQSWTVYYNNGGNSDSWDDWTQGFSHPARAAGLEGYDLRFADMDGDGKPDCVGVDRYGTLNVYVWSGNNMCATPLPHMNVHTTGEGEIPGSSYINLVDVNGDGLTDYVITDTSGSTRVWLRRLYDADKAAQEAQAVLMAYELKNYCNVDNNKPYVCTQAAFDAVYNAALADYSLWDDYFTVTVTPPAAPTVFRWADLDGDGKADLIEVTKEGGANAWHNPGISSTNSSLQSLGQIVDNKYLPASQVQFADMDGDGKADLIRANSISGLRIWLNKR
ncbi:MAG: FG-GAP-like repeat-containing protein [Janthinobacterium lividum]